MTHLKKIVIVILEQDYIAISNQVRKSCFFSSSEDEIEYPDYVPNMAMIDSTTSLGEQSLVILADPGYREGEVILNNNIDLLKVNKIISGYKNVYNKVQNRRNNFTVEQANYENT